MRTGPNFDVPLAEQRAVLPLLEDQLCVDILDREVPVLSRGVGDSIVIKPDVADCKSERMLARFKSNRIRGEREYSVTTAESMLMFCRIDHLLRLRRGLR